MKLTKRSMWQRAMALLLSFFMAMATLPAPALAESVAEGMSAEAQTEQPEGQQDEQTQPAEGQQDEQTQPTEPASQEGEQTAPTAPQEQTKPSQAPTTSNEEDVDALSDDKLVKVSIRVVGPNADGEHVDWIHEATPWVKESSNAWEASAKAFDEAELTYDAPTSSYGTYLNTITSPFTDEALGYNGDTGEYWQLFVNGKASEVGADSVVPADGQRIVWFYSGYGAELNDIRVSVRVVGPNADGTKDADWLATTNVWVPKDANAWTASAKAFDEAKLTYDAPTSSYGTYLNTITSPFTSEALGYDGETGKYWQFFVNGEASNVGVDGVIPANGDEILWYYSAFGDEAQDIDVDANAPRPNYTAFWAGFRGNNNRGDTDVQLPVTPGTLAWQTDLKGVSMFVNMSDPIIVNNDVYMAVGNEMRILDGATGTVKKTAPLATTINYASRIVYADGVVMVPLSGGRVQALTADELTTVWVTEKVPEEADKTQSQGTGVVHDGIAYFQTARMEGSVAAGGHIIAINISDGSIAWMRDNTSGGYYWAGPAFAGGSMVIADETGMVTAYDPKTGDVLSTLSVGGAVRAGVAASLDGSAVYVVTRDDGTLHKVSVSAAGKLSDAGSVKFAAYSTSTPTVIGGKVFVGGHDGDAYGSDSYGGTLNTGVLAVIGESSLAIQHKITAAKQIDGTTDRLPAEVKASPLVSTADGTHVYFTSNLNPGALYVYTDGDDEAAVLYEPEEGLQQYCLYTPIPTADGGVVYANDSGHIFKVVQGTEPDPEPEPEPDPEPEPEPNSEPDSDPDTPTPQMVTNAGDNVVKRTATVTYAMAVRVPEDATTVELKHTMEDPLVFVSKVGDVKVSIYKSEDTIDPDIVGVTLQDKTITVRVGANAKSSTAKGGTATSLDDIKGHMILVTFKAKLDKNPDLTSYLNKKKTVATIPCVATSTINDDASRSKTSQKKTVKYSTKTSSSSDDDDDDDEKTPSSDSSKTPNSDSSSSSSRTSTPSTGDPTSTALPIVLGALAVAGVGTGVFLKRHNRRSED